MKHILNVFSRFGTKYTVVGDKDPADLCGTNSFYEKDVSGNLVEMSKENWVELWRKYKNLTTKQEARLVETYLGWEVKECNSSGQWSVTVPVFESNPIVQAVEQITEGDECSVRKDLFASAQSGFVRGTHQAFVDDAEKVGCYFSDRLGISDALAGLENERKALKLVIADKDITVSSEPLITTKGGTTDQLWWFPPDVEKPIKLREYLRPTEVRELLKLKKEWTHEEKKLVRTRESFADLVPTSTLTVDMDVVFMYPDVIANLLVSAETIAPKNPVSVETPTFGVLFVKDGSIYNALPHADPGDWLETYDVNGNAVRVSLTKEQVEQLNTQQQEWSAADHALFAMLNINPKP